MKNKQKGLTLVELLISMTLGVIIASAATLLFITGQRSLAVQQGAADLQDNANFGLNLITKDMRLLNLDNETASIRSNTPLGGVVLTSSLNMENSDDATNPELTSNLYKTIVGTTAAVKFLTQSEIGPSNVKASSDLKSDQFTIQFMPEYIIEKRLGTDFYVGGFDCEGNELAYPRRDDSRGKRMVVQRYFLREDSNKNAKEPNETLALACDAGTYEPAKADGTEPPTKVENFGDNGQIIMKRVDYLHVLLGVDMGSNFRYMTINDYMAITTKKPRIVSVQLGILARSAQTVGRDANTIKDDQSFTVLDKVVSVKKVNDKNAPKYIRQVVSQTVAMRNGLGDR